MFTTAEPVRVDHTGIRIGGTLRLRGPGDPAALDPACLDDAPSAQLVRLYARQLFTYQPETDLRRWQAIAPVPDLAAQIPSIYNAGLGTSGTTYVVHLRPGSQWDTDVPRPVTAHDVVRGMKRLANPIRPASALPYFTSTIRGMAQFHADFAAALRDREPTAEEFAAFQNNHEIPGIFALDDDSLVFELVRPTLDFISMLALPAVAPAPVEYDAFLPDSLALRQHLRSNGPYRVTHYRPGKELVLEPNPAWQQETDPVRRQYLDRIEVGLGSAADPAELAAQIRGGTVDLAWNAPVAAPSGDRPADPGTGLGYRLDPCLVFNLRSPNAGGALRDVRVRQAIAFAVDKVAVAAAVAGLGIGTAVRLAGGIVPPNNDYHADADPDPGGHVDRARALLAEAGHADGLTLTAVHPDTPEPTAVARSYATDLERAGITVRLVALPAAAYRELVADPARAAAGEWDLTTLSWSPDWLHGNGRVFLQRLFQSSSSRGTGNRGGYSEPEVDRLIERALGDIDPRRTKAAWQEAERRVLADLPVVPILFQTPASARLHGPSVRDAMAMPSLNYDYDLSTLWLDPSD